MQYENYSFGEALSHLAERAGVELPKIEYSKEARAKAEKRAALLEINKKAAQYFYYQLRREGGKNAHDYLTGRGLSEETIRKFGLGYSDKYSDDLYKYLKSQNYSDELLRESGLFNVDERQGMYDNFWHRVIFPIMDVNNRVIGFGGRVMGDGKPKYLNSPETRISVSYTHLPCLFASVRTPYKRLSKAGIERTLKKLGESANVTNVHPHRYRRTLATNLLDRGANIQDVAAVLGHADLKTTQVYCYISQSNVRASYNKYSA